MKRLYILLTLAGCICVSAMESPLQAQTSTAAPNVHLLSDSFHMPQLNRGRRIWIYLPPDYDTTAKHYPVLYMHDAQNIFDDTSAFGGNEWGIDESLNTLFAGGDRGCIVVGIESSAQRLSEYSPWVNSTVMNAAEGDAYMQFVINTLKPYVDAHYRTLTGRLQTGLAGSSMGGLISLYGAIRYPNVFAKAGVLSPSIWFSEGEMDNTINQFGKQSNMRIYLYVGSAEAGTNVTDVNNTFAALTANGFDTSDVVQVINPGGTHNEATWAQVFPACYQWLMMNIAYTIGVNDIQSEQIGFHLVPNPATNQVSISIEIDKNQNTIVSVFNVSGRVMEVINIALEAGNHLLSLNTENYPAGIYFVRVTSPYNSFSRKLEIVR